MKNTERPTATYWVDYLTGAGDFEITGTLEEAKRAADDGASYTQRDILIYKQIKLDGPGDLYDSELVCGRVWYGVELTEEDMTEDEDQYITFGSFGFYAPWQEVDGND